MPAQHGGSAPQATEQAIIAALLSWVAGGVDAVGYLTLYHQYTAHMSGNTVAAGGEIGEHRWSQVLRSAVPILLYVLGVGAGAVMGESAIRRQAHSPFGPILCLEASLLLAFAMLTYTTGSGCDVPMVPVWRFYAVAACLPLAMGVQNTTLRKAGSVSIRTTYISGVLCDFAEAAVGAVLFWRTRRLPAEERYPERFRLLVLGGVVVLYVGGAAYSTVFELAHGVAAIWIPLAGLAVVLAVDLFQPFYTSTEDPLKEPGTQN